MANEKKIGGIIAVLLILSGGGIYYMDQNNNEIEVVCSQIFIEQTMNQTGEQTHFYNITFMNNITMQNETQVYNYTTPIYTTINKTYCPKDKVSKIILNNGKQIIFLEGKTYSLKNTTLTIKDLERGGSWGDRDLDSCWMENGVICDQYDISNPNNIRKIKSVSDRDKKGVEKLE